VNRARKLNKATSESGFGRRQDGVLVERSQS